MSLKTAIVYGSVRRDRMGIRVVRFLEAQIQERGHEADVIDAKEENLPLLDLRLSDFDADNRPASLVRLSERIKAADAFVLVSGEYNHTLQPGLTNLIDHF
ncbi:MAG: NAD(P)H-dependent oxidoreductase, partial [Pseudomonadota bacterium]